LYECHKTDKGEEKEEKKKMYARGKNPKWKRCLKMKFPTIFSKQTRKENNKR